MASNITCKPGQIGIVNLKVLRKDVHGRNMSPFGCILDLRIWSLQFLESIIKINANLQIALILNIKINNHNKVIWLHSLCEGAKMVLAVSAIIYMNMKHKVDANYCEYLGGTK